MLVEYSFIVRDFSLIYDRPQIEATVPRVWGS